MARFEYPLVVEGDEESWTARIGDDENSPLRGWGTSPLQAVRELCATLSEWPITGAQAWLSTEEGARLRARFVHEAPDTRGQAKS